MNTPRIPDPLTYRGRYHISELRDLIVFEKTDSGTPFVTGVYEGCFYDEETDTEFTEEYEVTLHYVPYYGMDLTNPSKKHFGWYQATGARRLSTTMGCKPGSLPAKGFRPMPSDEGFSSWEDAVNSPEFRKQWEFRVKQGGIKYPTEAYTLPDELPTPPSVSLPPLTRPRPPFDRLGPRIRPTHPGAVQEPRSPTRADVAELGTLLQQRRDTISTYAEENHNSLRTQELRERLRTSPPRPKHQHSCTNCGYKLPDEY